MEQSAKNIHFNEMALTDLALINEQLVARGDYSLAYRNLARSLEKRFDTALLRWRRLESPVEDMKVVLKISADMSAAIRNWQIDDETLNGYADIWNLVRYTSYFLDQSADLPESTIKRIGGDRSQLAEITLDCQILDVIEGREWREDIAETIELLAVNRRQMLVAQTYRTYLDLLKTAGNEDQAEALVRIAEANYTKRARDSFYSGGPTYMGGGPDNRYVVDFTLAAVLKRTGWAGDTPHKWTWDLREDHVLP